MMTFVLSSIKSDFALTSAQAGTLASMSFLGMFIGAGTAGLLADRFGRCVIFRVSIVIWGLSSLACAFAPDASTLMVLRVFLGIGMAMELPVGQSLVCEFVPSKVRGKYIALLEGAWPIGFICAGIIAHLLLPMIGWRGMFIAEALPALFVMVIRRIVPESPRWLVESGHFDRAKSIVDEMESQVRSRLVKSGQDSTLSTSASLAYDLDTTYSSTRTSKCEAGVAGEAAESTIHRKHLKDIFAPIGQLWRGQYARRTTMVWSLWFFALLGYYGLTTWLGALLEEKGFSMATSTEYVILISLAGVPGFFFAAWLIERWGRKPSMILMLVASAVFAFLYGSVSQTQLMIACGFAMQFFLFGMWSVLYAYTPELYPTTSRATGAGFASSVGRLGALLGPTLVGLILPTGGQIGVFAMAAGSLLAAALSVGILGPETKGKLLEEI